MDYLDFFSSILKALAWPVTTLIVFFSIRKKLEALLDNLTRIKFKDVELEVRQQIHEVAVVAQDALSDEMSDANVAEEITIFDRILNQAEDSPRSAIIEAWVEVEKNAKKAVRARGGKMPSSRLLGPTSLRHILVKARILNDKQVEVYEQLRRIRNRAVHFSHLNLSPLEVQEYVTSALALARQLEKVSVDFRV